MVTTREMALEDCSFLNTLRNDCVGFLHDSRTFTLEETLKWYIGLSFPYYIILKDGEKVGYIRTSDYSQVNRSLYVGCDIVKEHRGKGVAYGTFIEFLPWLFNEYDLHKVYAEVLEPNIASLNLYKKLGFEQEGVKREAVLKNGKFINSILLSLLETEVIFISV